MYSLQINMDGWGFIRKLEARAYLLRNGNEAAMIARAASHQKEYGVAALYRVKALGEAIARSIGGIFLGGSATISISSDHSDRWVLPSKLYYRWAPGS